MGIHSSIKLKLSLISNHQVQHWIIKEKETQKEMKLQLASLLALSASAAHIRSRRGVSGTGCPIDWIQADGPDNCLPDGDDFAVTCRTDMMVISFNLNHQYNDVVSEMLNNHTKMVLLTNI